MSFEKKQIKWNQSIDLCNEKCYPHTVCLLLWFPILSLTFYFKWLICWLDIGKPWWVWYHLKILFPKLHLLVFHIILTMPLFFFFPKLCQLYSSKQNYHVPPLFGLNVTFEGRPKRLVLLDLILVLLFPKLHLLHSSFYVPGRAHCSQEAGEGRCTIPTLVIYTQGYPRNSNNQRFIEFWKA